MSPRLFPALLCAIIAPAPLAAQFPKIAYELQQGSSILDECLLCGRVDVERPISGTFMLQRLPVKIVGELYELSEISFACDTCGISIEGSGRIHRPNFTDITPSLDLTINGVGGIALASEQAPALAPWPLIDFTVTEDGTRAPGHKYTIRVIAAPKVDLVPYEVVPGNPKDGTGSFLYVVCPVCRLANPSVPLDGSLSVGLVEAVDDGFSKYRLDRIHLVDLLPDADRMVEGSGVYEEGGDATIEKQMRLTVTVDGLPVRDLRGGPVPVKPGEAFPVIDMEVEEVVQESLWYRLHLVARPAGPLPFRRGDANADGTLDVADPIFHLLWRFSGGAEPTCLEAADADADGAHDLTDAIFELQYLFVGGPEPPAPGARDCGTAPAPKFGCNAYSACQ